MTEQPQPSFNFVSDVVDSRPSGRPALTELTAGGEVREWAFGEVSLASGRLAGRLERLGLGKGDVVMTLLGNCSEWVLTMLACFRQGFVALPCTEQLRAGDLRLRIEAARPRAIVVHERDSGELEQALRMLGGGYPAPEVLRVPDPGFLKGEPVPARQLTADDPCLITFTSGTSGEAKAALHGQRYLSGQRLQAESWMAAGPGDLVWCTAASGWSKSARNAFIAPWLRGASVLLHDGRFDPAERLDLIERFGVNVLCMAPTEYRAIARRAELRPLPSIRSMVAAGEALDAEVVDHFQEALGVRIRDGYGQTETGQLTGVLESDPPRSGSMGRALPGVGLRLDGDELIVDPASVPTFFLGYLGSEPPAGPWRTGDRVTVDEDGFYYFQGRSDDIIISSGYRIGPAEVEASLISHPAVAESAAIPLPDPERGSVVKAVVVLRAGFEPSTALTEELKDHAKAQTAPFKYPRVIEFAEALPKTASGKIQRAALRDG